ncbi:MAG: hypothetical protein WCA20_24740 [Candidatus Sulfotelmatobacter sp.]
MAEGNHKNWIDLCNAALQAKDPDELLRIVQELNEVLKREEQVRRDFREASRANQSLGEVQCQ